jgi:hypothetical protein
VREQRGNWQWQAPPGWPPAPWGWSPPPGWQSLPEWGPAPDGWQFWLWVPRVRKFGWGWICTHTALVAIIVVTYYATWWDANPDDGRAVGNGGIIPPLMPLGLPWNLPAFRNIDWAPESPEPVPSLYFLGPAILNLMIHLGWRARRWRRRGRLAAAPVAPPATVPLS